MNSNLGSVHAAWMSQGAGIFNWDIEANRLYGDRVVASYHGLDADKAQTGLPLQDYISAVYPDDKAKVAKALHDALVSNDSYHEEYRLIQKDGSLIWVLAIGHCFRNADGNPSVYSGVVYDITEQKLSRTDGIADHCHAALHVARRLDNDRLIGLLEDAITETREENLRETLRVSMRH